MPTRIVALDRARTFVTLLVLLHHSALNFTYFGNGDPARWLGFDLFVLFNDSFFIAAMFFISGLFVPQTLADRDPAKYLRKRSIRLGIPFLVSIFVLMPIAYYPTFLRYHLPGTTDLSFTGFWWRTLMVGPWPSGPAWFLWVLLALNALAALLWAYAPDIVTRAGSAVAALRQTPGRAVALFVLVTIAAYVPLRLAAGDAAWLAVGPIPIQTSRILLYATSFFAGVAVGATDLRGNLLAAHGGIARLWPRWLGVALIAYLGIVFFVYLKHSVLPDPGSLPNWWETGYGFLFAIFSATMLPALLGLMLRFADSRMTLLDAMQPSAYGIYLLHYIAIIWLQYAVFDVSLPAFAKFAIVFAGTLALSWGATLLLRRMPAIAKII